MEFWQDGFENTYVGSVNRLAMVVHPLNFHNIRLKEKRIWKDGVEIRETYNYNLQTQQLKEKQIGLSDGGTLKITYTYPNDCPWGIYTTMTQKHCISPIVEEKKFKNGRLMESILTEYLQVSEGLYLPSVQHYSEITTPLAASTVTFRQRGVIKQSIRQITSCIIITINTGMYSTYLLITGKVLIYGAIKGNILWQR